ncbi:MAG TPA: M28 family metallopeptidase [Actinophytocola sp.]|uniref:M28 family metallopeptidase n=1 Tax=Actinophytocola sp. TaxID=1872138 RepID=UPI002DB8F424|nr:M28 family metallopeptidase [Actinophytocola sp.]HEU5470585.1 M28 family metallopeptidase [Actinophytocola sp.]
MNDENPAISRRNVLAGAAVLGSVPIIGATAAHADEQTGDRGGRVPPDIRAMLREINPRNIERTINTLVSFGTRNTLSAQDHPTRGIGAARDWLFAEFTSAAAASGGRMTVELQSYIQGVAPRIPVPTPITNVVATLRGSSPDSVDRTYVVSGHYDSMPTSVTDFTSDAPGANDDASGVAAVLEMARVMATRTFDATIVFMAVAGEEQGLLGSNHFATTAKAAGRNIAGMFTNDIIGSSVGGAGEREPFTVRLFGEGLPTVANPALETDWRRFGGWETEGPPRQLARYIKDVAENDATRMKVKIIYRRDRFGRGGDHIPFLQQGYPAVRFTETNEDYRHQHIDVAVRDGVQFGDLPEFCDFDYIARVARVNAISLANLARSPAAPAGALFNVQGLRSDTVLRWNPNTEVNLSGYEVVVRDTTDLEWEDVMPVGNVTNVTFPNTSKDNFLYGVRAVNRNGFRSPVSFPSATST